MSTKRIACRYADSVFTPAEVHEVTGVSPQLQRAWRQRGFLGERRYGRASFSAREMGQILSLRYLGQELRIDLDFVSRGVEEAAAYILWLALGRKAAWLFAADVSHAQRAAFLKAVEAEDRIGLQYLDKVVGIKRGTVRRFLVHMPDEHKFTSDLNDHFWMVPGAIVLDLDEIARQLVENTPRPLVSVSDIEILN